MMVNFKEVFDPSSFLGSIFYGVLFVGIALLLSRMIKRFARKMISHAQKHSADKTAIIFYSRILQIGSFILILILYFHLIPSLRSVGTALLASAGVFSLIGGIAAQKSLGNIIAGISLLFYRPFRVGDKIQVSAPSGVETGIVDMIDLSYTILHSSDNRKIIIPNNILYESVIINLGQN